MLCLTMGTVVRVVEKRSGMQLLEVIIAETGAKESAISFLHMEHAIGDTLIVNTTAVRLQLGTGGYHLVVGKADAHPEADFIPSKWGHVMKMRYSPWQLAIDAVEEQDSPYHELFARQDLSLEGTPVLIGELHSLLPAAVIALKQNDPHMKIVYVMPDAASLPISLSGHVHRLQQLGYLDATVTTGHAWGGDREAVTIHSGLLAARHVERADIIVCILGPGVTGTGTPYAFSGIQLAEVIHAVSALGGFPMMIPRISFADTRLRHYGLSHHTSALLNRFALRPVVLPMPQLGNERDAILEQQIFELQKLDKHVIIRGMVANMNRVARMEKEYGSAFTTMGRSWQADPVPFQTAVLAADLLSGWRADLAEAFSADPQCFSSLDKLAALDLFWTRNEEQP